MSFPIDSPQKVELQDDWKQAFNPQPLEVWKGKTMLMFTFEKQKNIETLEVNLEEVSKFPCQGIITTSQGEEKHDFISRFFAPQSGINEDPVTGSAHTVLSSYWANVLKKENLTAKQISPRGGELNCEISKNDVKITGKAQLYSTVIINL